MEKLIPYSGNLCSKDAEKMISIKIGSLCNARCSFCVDRGGHNAAPLPNVEKITEEAIKLEDYKTVIITGGEPFLYFKEVKELLKLIRPYKTRLVLNTNGSLLDSEKVQELNDLIDELQISIHNSSESINNSIFGFHDLIRFDDIRNAIEDAKFTVSINSTFNKTWKPGKDEINKMENLCAYLGADKLRLTELKKVDETEFVSADEFLKCWKQMPGRNPLSSFLPGSTTTERSDDDLITKGCTLYVRDIYGILVSIKRLCKYAKGKNAPAFSCCFVDNEGQTKIDVDTKDTFKVIYSDGSVYNDWIFTGL